jgi:hypothetical protein
MKIFIRIMIIVVLTISFASAVTFPLGIIKFHYGTEMRVKRVSVEDEFVYYKWKGEKRSAMLEDVEFIKVRGKVERVIGGITGGLGLLASGAVTAVISDDVVSENPGFFSGMVVGVTTVTYLGGRLVGKLFDPWRQIYKAPAIPDKIDESF